MAKTEKKYNTTFYEIHNNEKTIRKIPLCHSKYVETIDENWYSPSYSIFCLWKSEELIRDSEHSTTIDEGIDDDSIKRIIGQIPYSQTR